MRITLIKAKCLYSEFDNAISSLISLASEHKTTVHLLVIKDLGKDFYETNRYGIATCTISKNSNVDTIKQYIDKIYSKGQFKRTLYIW